MFSMLLLVVSSSGQSAVGMQYWGSFGGGPFDSLNLGNLNNHVVIPIRHKAGRGLAFSYDLTYDSDIWYPTTVNGVKTWQPLSSLQGGYWGWQNLLYSAGSSVTYSTTTTTGHCGMTGQDTWTQTAYSNWVDTDWTGSHSFGYTANWIDVSPPSASGVNCPTIGAAPSVAPAIPASDRSGLTLYAVATSSSSVSWSITSPQGYQQFQPGSGEFQQDANGNQITASNGVYKDTLGQTALTVAGGSPPNNTTFTYTAPSGTSAQIAVSYKPYTVTTNFGCSGVSEYSQTNIYLVDKITLPDQTFYQFGYEQTIGQGSSVVTARLVSVSLPTGGSVTYSYGTTSGGANNGINCPDGTAPTGTSTNPSLTRALSLEAPGNMCERRCRATTGKQLLHPPQIPR